MATVHAGKGRTSHRDDVLPGRARFAPRAFGFFLLDLAVQGPVRTGTGCRSAHPLGLRAGEARHG